MDFGFVNWDNNPKHQHTFSKLKWQDDLGISPHYQTFTQNKITAIADARIDNHAELCKRLLLSERVSEAELCCHLYQKYGLSFCEQLHGDFAVVIFDKAQKRVVAATDLFGIRPLYYAHRAGHYFLFSFSTQGIFSSQLVSKTIDENSVYSFFRHYSRQVPPSEDTFFEAIKTVRAGHFLVADSNSATQFFYWKIPPKPSLVLSENDYGAAFKTHFDGAVWKRTSPHKRVATQLSGGLDSNAVTATAVGFGQQTVLPFHIDTGHASTDEKYYVRKLIEKTRLPVRFVAPSQDVYADLVLQTQLLNAPSHYTSPFSFFKSSFDLIREAGCQTLLTGHDGDSVVGYGRAHLEQMIKNKDWTSVKHYLLGSLDRDLSPVFEQWNNWDDPTKYYYSAQRTLLQDLKKQISSGQFLSQLKTLNQDFGVPYWAIARYLLQKITQLKNHSFAEWQVLNPDFSAAFSQKPLTEFIYFADADATHREYLENVLDFNFFRVNQETTLLARAWGFEVSHPFFDRKLLEFNLFVPEQVRFGATGLGRMPLRMAMQGVLPEEIRLRRSKTPFDDFLLDSLRTLANTSPAISRQHLLWKYLNPKTFKQQLAQIQDVKKPHLIKNAAKKDLLKSYFLAVWLDTLPT